MRDPYPGATTPGGQPIVDAVQRGIAVVVDNDVLMAFAMHGGTISDFQKQAGTFVRADLDISGVTVLGGGAQPVMAQNGFSINRSTGSVSNNTIGGIGYAGPAAAYSGAILASSNTDLRITNNLIQGSNIDDAAAKVVGIWVYQNGPANSGGEISGNGISYADVGIAVDDSITPKTLLIEFNQVVNGDLTDPYSAGVRFEPMPVTVTVPFDIDGTEMHDKLAGNAGNDILSGLGGKDELRGNGGDDRLDGGTGADTMIGGAGDDLYFVDDMDDVVVEAAGEGNDTVHTALATYVLPDHVETLTGTRSGGGQDFRGNARSNIATGGDANDVFRMQDGGNDSVDGRGGRDAVYFGATFTSADTVDTGEGVDALGLQGDYSDGITFGVGAISNIVGVESIALLSASNTSYGYTGGGAFSYNLTMLDSNVSRTVLKISGAHLGAGENFTFDGSAETDGVYLVYGGYGTDTFTGGSQGDTFVFAPGRFQAGDSVDGGGGLDGINLRGNYTIDFNAPGFEGSLTSVEVVQLVSASDHTHSSSGGPEFDYDIVFDDDMIAAGETMQFNGSKLLASETMYFDGSQETSGTLNLFGGASADTLIGGGGKDTISGGRGGDSLTGNGGADVFRYNRLEDSLAAGSDTIHAFSTLADKIDLMRVDANSHVAGDQAFTWIGANAFSGGGTSSAGQLRAYESAPGSGAWTVEGDVDGDGTVDLVIEVAVQPGQAFTGAEFMF